MKTKVLKRIQLRWTPVAAGMLLACAASQGYAAVTCTSFPTSSTNFVYVSSSNNASAGQSGLNNVVQNNVSFSCTRTGALTPTTVAFGVTNGDHASGGINRAQLGASTNRIFYNTFQDAGCSVVLNDAAAGRITKLLTAALNVAETINVQFYTCINTSQNVTSFPSGFYTDGPNMNLRYAGGGAAIDRTADLLVSINAPALCGITGLPASNTINFAYTAFQGTAAFQAASFNAVCTNLLPYTMSVSPTAGVIGGLNYQLGISTGAAGSAGSLGPTSLTDVGGALGTKVHFINASMQAGQAGQVGGPTSNGHTLTITY